MRFPWLSVCLVLLLALTQFTACGDDTASTPADETDTSSPFIDLVEDEETDAEIQDSSSIDSSEPITDSGISDHGVDTEPSDGTPEDTAPPKAVVYLGIMVHLEGWKVDSDSVYENYNTIIRDYADLFEAHGAKLTLESKELTTACLLHGDITSCILNEMEERGHGIGVHADLGSNPNPNYSVEQFTKDLIQRRELLETYNVEVRHVSGICSPLDWVKAAVDAGYLFTTGVVGYCALSLDPTLMPPEYADCANPAECHDNYPPSLLARTQPWRVKDGATWIEPDPTGKLVVLPTLAGLSHLHEELEAPEPVEEAVFDDKDIQAFRNAMDKVVAQAKPGKVTIFYLAWSLGGQLEPNMLEKFLVAADSYVQAGQVEWKTLPEMYDAFVAWEQLQQP